MADDRSPEEIWDAQGPLAHRLHDTFREWARLQNWPASIVMVAHAMTMSAAAEAIASAGLAALGGPSKQQMRNAVDSRALLLHAIDQLDKFIADGRN